MEQNIQPDLFGDWDYVLSLLPEGWQEKIHELKLLKGGHKFSGSDAESILLRVLFIHLAAGLSLRETSAYCKASGLVNVSDVAILKRLRNSENFFNWCILKLKSPYQETDLPHLRIRVFDSSLVHEPGVTGALWRLHYSLDLKTLECDEIKISDYKTGEGFKNYTISQNELILADRGYSRGVNVNAAHEKGAFVLLRFTPTMLPLFDPVTGTAFQVLPKLKKLHYSQHGDWDVTIHHDNKNIAGHLIAIKVPPAVAEKQKAVARRAAAKRKEKIQDRTLKYAEYLMLFTTLPKDSYPADKILKLYRFRWQIELVFKRLKSLLGIGHLPKYDPQSSRAWLSGKILIAHLLEKILRIAEDFSPSED